MIKCHFIDVLKTFHADELHNFRNYIDSPYFNKRKKLVELYDIIKDYYPFFTDENFSREKIFEVIYPDEPYQYGKINEGLSALYKLSLNFIKQISFEQNNIYGDIVFLEELRKRSLKQIFILKTKNIDSEIDTFKNLDSDLFLKQYLVEIEKSNFISIFGKNSRKEKIQIFLSQINKNFVALTNFYISELISLSVNSFNLSHSFQDPVGNVFKKIREFSIVPQLFTIIKPYNKYNSYINLLNYYFEAIYDLECSDKYYLYKKMVFDYQAMMSPDDLSYHLNCLKSYCVIKKNTTKQKEEFAKEYVNLQEIILQKKLFIDSKSQFFIKEQFLNMLSTYDMFKEKNKIKLLLNYIKYLHPDSREDMKLLAEAHFHFFNFSYEKVFSALKKITIKDRTFEEKINILEIRALYETENFVDCIEKINLFRKQRRTNKIMNRRRTETQLAFLNIVEKLIKIKEKKSNFDAEYFKKIIDENQSVTSKEWLIEKCYELYEKPKQSYQY